MTTATAMIVLDLWIMEETGEECKGGGVVKSSGRVSSGRRWAGKRACENINDVNGVERRERTRRPVTSCNRLPK
jgi:hypothetical protein